MVIGTVIEPENKDAEDLKDDEGGEGTPTGQETDPLKSKQDPPADDPAKGDQEAGFRADLVKRFGQKSDQELVKEVWKAYRNGETTFSQTQEKVKELEALVSQFGGVEALKQALNAPAPAAKPAGEQYPAKVRSLIDQGLLDPNDPIAALLIDQERRLEQSQQFLGQTNHERAVQTFDTWLRVTAGKHEFADMDVIRDMGLRGAFANMTDAQVQATIEQIASRQHAKVAGLVEGKTQAKLDELKKLGDKKILDGKPGGGRAAELTPEQAFNHEFDRHIKEE
jgi:hypothetical protein